jgi:hypothetical protein
MTAGFPLGQGYEFMFSRLVKWYFVAEVTGAILLGSSAVVAHTVTVLDTGGGGPGNGVDVRPCIFFQVDNQSTWYAIPDSSPHAIQSYNALHDSFITGGGQPFSFNVGNPVGACSNVQEAVSLLQGTYY